MKLRILLLAVMLFGVRAVAQNPEWTTAQQPFKIADNLYYVGSKDLASFLITTNAGHLLINANVESSPALIRASVTQLGFKWEDIKILLNSQAHMDHVGGMAQVRRETGARTMVMQADADVMTSGGRTDFAFGPAQQFPEVVVDAVLNDKDTIRLGNMVVVAYKTGGHTKGCTTFTLMTHLPGDPAEKLRHVVIVGGLSALDNYNLVPQNGKPESYPGIANDFQAAFSRLKQLPCDIFLGAHGSYFGMKAKLARRAKAGHKVWIDPAGYRQKIKQSEQDFREMLAAQKGR